MRLKHSSKIQLIVWLILYSFLISLLAPWSVAGEGIKGFGGALGFIPQGQRNDPRPVLGAPEGEFPDLNEIRHRNPRSPRAPREIPSTIRSRRNPLVPWDGRRVGDPLPFTGSAPALPNRINESVAVTKRRSLSERRGGKSVAAKLHHSTRASTSPPVPDDQFIQNFFYWALLRNPNGTEATYWNDNYRKAHANGQGSLVLATRELGKTMFESSEYAARARDNHWYVYDLYKTFLMRDPDPGGWAFWESIVPSAGRENVRRGFEDSTELANLLATVTPNGSISSGVSSLLTARSHPSNQPGNGMLAKDANWSLTLLSLGGRSELDLGLVLSYSSLVWTRSGPYIYFDEDNGFPSPGFRLGFPTVQRRLFQAQVGKNAYLLITPAGQRVELRQVGATNTYEAADSSYLQLIDNGSTLLVRSMDGTQFSYSEFNNEYHCTQIKDRNGNYISVTYNGLGQITTITDTLARVISFNYDGNANLLSISQSWNGQTHNWATFGWGTRTMQSNFSGLSVVGAPNGTVIPVITQVGLHDGSYFTFDYTNSLQVSIMRRYTSDQVQRSSTAFDYDGATSECPLLTASRVSAHNWTGINGVPAEVVTQYSIEGTGCVVTAPDGTIYKEFYGTGWQKGLTTLSEVWFGGVRQKWTTTAWTQDNLSVNYQQNPRVTETNVYDTAGNRRRTTIDYHASFGLPWMIAEYAADAATVLRRTYLDYKNDSVYIDRRIIGLLFRRTVYDGNWNMMAKSEYGYDWDWGGDMFQDTPAPATQHDRTNYGPSFIAGRGNLSQVARFDVNDPNNAGNTWQETKWRFNSTGSVLMERDHLWHQSFISYGDSFSDGNNNRNTFAYPTTFTNADGFSSYAEYNFDFGAETRVQRPAPAGQSQGLIQTLTYNNAARLERVTTANNGAYKRYVHGPNYVQSFGTVNTVADESYAIQVFDGLGRVTGAAGNHPGSSGGYRAQLTAYDVMGRAMKQSNPTEINAGWAPAGDDAAGWLYTQQTYDWQGRPRIKTNPDGTTKEASYGGCGCAGGAVVTLTDEGTLDVGVAKRRQQKIYSDALGRTVKTEELNWQGGSVYSATVNTYNARDQITQIRHYAGPEGSGNFQDTSMTYDGHGRLKTRHIPEQNAGTSTTWDYNSDDTIQKITDARGASQTFNYNSRHLPTGITYAVPGGSNIPVPSSVSINYDAAGNRTQMSDGTGTATHQYDSLSRMTSETRSFNGISNSYTLNYGYNLAGQLGSLTDGFSGQVTYQYDHAGRVQSVGSTGYIASYYNFSTWQTITQPVPHIISEIKYRAWGDAKQTTYGNGVYETTSYNSRLKPATFNVNHVRLQCGVGQGCSIPSATMTWTYDYHADARVSHAYDVNNNKFDRRYEFDHLARYKEGYTNREARHQASYVYDPDPYRHSVQYDVWSNITNRTGRLWSIGQSDSAAYTNNRRQFWGYDAGGNLLTDNNNEHTYNARNDQTYVKSFATVGDGTPNFPVNPALEINQSYDGEGTVSKRRQITRQEWFEQTEQGPVLTNIYANDETTYYLRSSVLAGAVVAEISEWQGQGYKKQINFYANGRRVAREDQYTTAVKYEHANRVTGSWVETNGHSDDRWAWREERDPFGADLPQGDPAPPITFPGGSDGQLYFLGGDPFDLSGGCAIDGMPMSCSEVQQRMESGTVEAEYPGIWINGRNGRVNERRPIINYGVGVFGIYLPDGSRGNDRQFNLYLFSFAQKPTSDQQSRFDAAKADLLNRLGENDGKNPCADLFGGYDKAIKALNDSKFSFMDLGAPVSADIGGDFVHAAVKGKNVYINSQGGFMAVNGQVPTQLSMLANTDRPNERAFVTRAVVPGGSVEFRNDVKFASFILLHELGHRRGIYKNDNKDGIDDKHGTRLDKTARNNKKILDDCFPE